MDVSTHPRTAMLGACLTAVCLALSACASLSRNATPVEYIYAATVLGTQDIRAWGGILSPLFQQDLVQSGLQARNAGWPKNHATLAALAISGGGSAGAFGAGFLNGWSATGKRPDFKLVTGISTGALIAPFAFLGSAYDAQLEEVYTTISTSDILKRNRLLGIIFRKDSLADSAPLRNLVARYVDTDFLRAVAARHAEGRRLYIGTTNMDAQRLSVWNMGRIASMGTLEAGQLFRDVMVASSSLPVALPPVMIQVEVDGQRYDEMHTDGGTVTQVFFEAGVVDLGAAHREVYGSDSNHLGNLYVLRNGQLGPEPEIVERELRSISGRAIETMIKSAALNNLYRIFAFCQRDAIGFHYVDLPDDYREESHEMFDNEAMQRLFEIGYELGRSGDEWQTEPPGYRSREGALSPRL